MASDDPQLFGIVNSNRDFCEKSDWGKNQFNNAFPVALVNYMYSKGISLVYLKYDNSTVEHGKLCASEFFGFKPDDPNAFFNFEAEYPPFSLLVEGVLPRIDLVTSLIKDDSLDVCRGIEIKLTALPDNQTAEEADDKNYGSELVVRPDTIVYLVLGIARNFRKKREELYQLLKGDSFDGINWESIIEVSPRLVEIAKVLDNFCQEYGSLQEPYLLQPIWKTRGKSLVLEDDCLDVFVWSDIAFSRLFIDPAMSRTDSGRITRTERSVVWVYKMLLDFAIDGKIDHQEVEDTLTFGTRNDKAFALGGARTREYMTCSELTKPRVKRDAIKEIVLNGGQKFLSPERRFDAALLSTPELFE